MYIDYTSANVSMLAILHLHVHMHTDDPYHTWLKELYGIARKFGGLVDCRPLAYIRMAIPSPNLNLQIHL